MKLRFGIVGTGAMAARMAETILRSGDADLVAVASPDSARALKFAEAHAPIIACASVAELLSRNDVDAVYIANRNTQHAETAIAALEARKPVLCEKPCTISHADAERVIAAAKQSRTLFMEGLWTLFLPAHQRLIAAAKKAELGTARHLYADFGHLTSRSEYPQLYDNGGGVLLDRAVYPLALAIAAFGPAREVQCRIGLTDGVETDAALTLAHEGGRRSQIAASFVAEMANVAVLACEGGVMRLGPPLLGAEEIVIEKRTRQTPGKESGGGIKSQLVAALKTLPAARRLKRNAAAKSETHAFGADQYLPQLRHFIALVRSGAQESDIASFALSSEIQRVIEEARRQSRALPE